MDILLESNFNISDYQPIFFDRPVNNMRKKNIAVLVGSNTNIFEIQQVYMIIRAMNHNPVLIADESLRDIGLPADIYLSKHSKKQVYENSDEAIALISGCHCMIAGVGLELNSSMQLLLDKIINSYSGLIVLTEATFKSPGIQETFSKNTLLLGSTKKLLSLGQGRTGVAKSSGLLRKLELLHRFVTGYDGGLVCVEEFQVLGLESTSGTATVINAKNSIDAVAFMAILVSLLSDRDRLLNGSWQKYFLAAGYLYKNYYQINKNPLEITRFLQDQF